MLALLLTIVSILPVPDASLRESVDLIELNHFYDEQGRLIFDQVIFYDWSEGDRRFDVRAWRLVKSPEQIPQREAVGYSTLWQDGEKLRHVQSRAFRETWTQYDPELAEREYLPKELRRDLRQSQTQGKNRWPKTSTAKN